jgi:hypothetical protein
VQTKNIIILVVCGAIALGASLFGAYSLGARDERTRANIELAKLRDEYSTYRADTDRSMEQLRLSLDESKGRADSISRGLGEAVKLASSATDRNQRITILIGAVDTAIRGLRKGPND